MRSARMHEKLFRCCSQHEVSQYSAVVLRRGSRGVEAYAKMLNTAVRLLARSFGNTHGDAQPFRWVTVKGEHGERWGGHE